MTQELLFSLSEERSVFSKFNSYFETENFVAYCSPNLDEIPHWNLIYPKFKQTLIPSADELKILKEYYQSKNISGHLAVNKSALYNIYSEESEYFKLEKSTDINFKFDVSEMSHTENELQSFCELVQKSFNLKSDTIEYFYSKMLVLQQNINSKFFVIKSKNKIIGGCSVFQCAHDSSFMFNVATHPDFQGQKVAQTVIAYASSHCQSPVFTYSHNELMRETILPKVGFKSIGTITCVPLSSLVGI